MTVAGSDAEGRIVGAPGTQTLARGLTALQLVADSGGLTVHEVADRLAIHRTIAYRLLSTLVSFRYLVRGEDGRYRPAAALVALGNSFDRSVRHICMPILQRLAAQQRATVSLLVAEGEDAVAIAVIVPRDADYHLSFRESSRHPLDRGAAGAALRACMPPHAAEPSIVTRTRLRGWAMTCGEVEPNTYGLAAPVHRPLPAPPTCINLITHRAEVAESSAAAVVRAAGELAKALC